MIESIVAWAAVHMPNVVYLWEDLWESVVQTLIMLGIAGAFSLVLGVLLGILLVVTADGGLYAHPVFHSALSKIINVFRSLPFVILIALLGLTTMAGAVGGGGVGSFAIRYGYNRFMNDITLVTVVILLIFVNVIQGIGNLIIKKLTH